MATQRAPSHPPIILVSAALLLVLTAMGPAYEARAQGPSTPTVESNQQG